MERNLNAFTLSAYSIVLEDRVACASRKADLRAQKPNAVTFSPEDALFNGVEKPS